MSCATTTSRPRRRPTASPSTTPCSSRPGPGKPSDAGVSIAVVRAAYDAQKPLLGVCLGHQAIAEAFGATVTNADELMHGKTSVVTHDDSSLVRRRAAALHGHAVPLARGRGRHGTRGARGDRAYGRRSDHGGHAPGCAAVRRAVPPRVGADRGRLHSARQLAGGCGSHGRSRVSASARHRSSASECCWSSSLARASGGFRYPLLFVAGLLNQCWSSSADA